MEFVDRHDWLVEVDLVEPASDGGLATRCRVVDLVADELLIGLTVVPEVLRRLVLGPDEGALLEVIGKGFGAALDVVLLDDSLAVLELAGFGPVPPHLGGMNTCEGGHVACLAGDLVGVVVQLEVAEGCACRVVTFLGVHRVGTRRVAGLAVHAMARTSSVEELVLVLGIERRVGARDIVFESRVALGALEVATVLGEMDIEIPGRFLGRCPCRHA